MTNKSGHLAASFKVNIVGRDFVVGDIHGAYPLLYAAMEAAEFNPEVDRLFSLGDLIDRGSNSPEAINFLSKPYVHAVRGNHEMAFLDIFSGIELDATLTINASVIKYYAEAYRAQWCLDASREELESMVRAFSVLPVAIDVETTSGLIGLVHADVPGGHWDEFVNLVRAGDDESMMAAMEDRDRVLRGESSVVEGVDYVFVGHTIVPFIQELGNVFAIDTGAVFREKRGSGASERLTLINMTSGSYSHMTAPHIKTDAYAIYL